LKSLRGTYDVVAANILLNPLLEMVEDIVGYAKSGGIIVVSGILEEHVKSSRGGWMNMNLTCVTCNISVCHYSFRIRSNVR
jgi:ribosomal protein L11 methylase PrmA